MICKNTIYLMDCIEGIKNIEDNTVDLVIADPPYFKIIKNDWDNAWENENQYLKWCLRWVSECVRVLKKGGQLCIWGGIGKDRQHPFIKLLLLIEKRHENVNFVNWITMKGFRVFGNARHFPFARQELMVFSKGKHSSYNKQYSDFEGTNRLGAPKLVSNVWVDCKDVSLFNKKGAHPTEKPELACERIVKSLSCTGDMVLIPFVGSCAEVLACIEHGRDYIGFETDKEYLEKAGIGYEARID